MIKTPNVLLCTHLLKLQSLTFTHTEFLVVVIAAKKSVVLSW